MHFYSMPLSEILDMPIYTFWELSKNVSRIMAEADIRMCSIVCSALGGADKLVRSLQNERGDIIKIDKSTTTGGFDRAGIAKLKMLMGG